MKKILAVAASATILVAGASVGAVAEDLIGSKDIKNNSIRTVDVRDNTLRVKDLRKTARDALRGKDGTNGVDGADGVSGYEVHNREVRLSDTTGSATVPCPEGKVALGGGFVAESIRGGTAVVHSAEPVYDAATGHATGWTASATATGNVNLKAWVTCAAIGDATND